MVVIQNNPDGAGGGSGGMVAAVLIILVVALLLIFGLPYLRGTRDSGTEINVPDQIDVNVNPGAGSE